MTRHRLKVSMPAILNMPGDRHIPVTLPAGAIVVESSRLSATLFGMVGIYWEGRHYSVYPTDLLRATERVEGV
jgi:hypothetical protein